MLLDFADVGNAAAGAVPRNMISVDIAPLSFAFETIVANERMNWLMNHELVHVVATDQAAPSRPLLPRPVPGQGVAGARSSRRRSSTPT